MSITIKKDGSITVETASEAAQILKLMNGTPEVAHTPDKSANTTDATMLLRAGGYETVKQTTLKVFSFLLDNNTRSWDAPTLAKRLDMKRDTVSSMLGTLNGRGIIVRTGTGQYRVK